MHISYDFDFHLKKDYIMLSKEYCSAESAMTFDKFHLKVSESKCFQFSVILLIISQCQQQGIGFLSSPDIYGWDNQARMPEERRHL